MWLAEGVRNPLAGKANPDFERVRAGLGEDAIVKTAPAPEAAAAGIEGESGADEGVDFPQRNFRRFGRGLEEIEGTGNEISTVVEGEVVAADLGIEPS